MMRAQPCRHRIAAVIAVVGVFGADLPVFLNEGFARLDAWRPVEFPKIPRHTVYSIVEDDGNPVLKAVSRASASGLPSGCPPWTTATGWVPASTTTTTCIASPASPTPSSAPTSAHTGATLVNTNDSIVGDEFGVATARNLGRHVAEVALQLAARG